VYEALWGAIFIPIVEHQRRQHFGSVVYNIYGKCVFLFLTPSAEYNFVLQRIAYEDLSNEGDTLMKRSPFTASKA
jgi:hypothetical protein